MINEGCKKLSVHYEKISNCCGYSLEVPVGAFVMSTHNLHFMEKKAKLFRAVPMKISVSTLLRHYDPKFSDRHLIANNADPDQTALRGAV